MRATRLALVLTIGLGALSPAVAAAPPGLDAARIALTKAIAARDWNGIANLTAWPLAIDMYQAAPRLTQAQYRKDHRKLTILFGDGDKDLLTCVATTPLTRQGDKKSFGYDSWVADCNGNEFYFGLRAGKALFTAYQNINE